MTDYDKLVKALRCCAGVHTKPTKCPDYGDSWCGGNCLDNHLIAAADAIEALQAQLPKRGEWIEANTRPRSAQFYCSVCHRTCYDIQPTRDKAWTKRCRYQFCPNCGAKMEVQDESAGSM